MENITKYTKKIFPMSEIDQETIFNQIKAEIQETHNYYQNFEKRFNHHFQDLKNEIEAQKNFHEQNVAFNVELFQNKLAELADQIQQNKQKNTQLLERISELEDITAKNQREILDIINYTKGLEESRSALYYPTGEYDYYKDALEGGFLNFENFERRILDLRKKLSDMSLETVSVIISRLKAIYQFNLPIINIFSKKEQQQIIALREHFYPNIIQIAEDKYCYKNYILPINHFEPCVFYYHHSIDKIRNLEFVRNKAIIDAGGFIGDSALIFSPLTDQNVYSFEPAPDNYTDMLKTIELNRIENIVAENLAFSDGNKKLKFSINGSVSSAHANKVFEYTDEIEVDAVSLDDYVEKNNLVVGLIKTDLEGAEQEFLRGAINTIKKYKPILLISIYHSIDDFLDIKPMIESWDLGYHFEIVKPVDGSIMFETMLIAEVYE